MPQEGEPRFQPCPEREQLIKKAASARREYDELRRNLGVVVIGTDEYHAVNQRARAALAEAETAMNEYLKHVQEHGC
jgi:predicted metal-binding transcription factor (methanogenesis marker protein 9)